MAYAAMGHAKDSTLTLADRNIEKPRNEIPLRYLGQRSPFPAYVSPLLAPP